MPPRFTAGASLLMSGVPIPDGAIYTTNLVISAPTTTSMTMWAVFDAAGVRAGRVGCIPGQFGRSPSSPSTGGAQIGASANSANDSTYAFRYKWPNATDGELLMGGGWTYNGTEAAWSITTDQLEYESTSVGSTGIDRLSHCSTLIDCTTYNSTFWSLCMFITNAATLAED